MTEGVESVYTVIGDHPQTRILAALIMSEKTMNATEIIESGVVSNGAFHNNIDALVESGAVVKARKVANSQLYTVDESNPVVAALSDVLDNPT